MFCEKLLLVKNIYGIYLIKKGPENTYNPACQNISSTVSVQLIIKSSKGPFIFYQEGGVVVLRAFIDNFVLTPQQMQENFQWPLSTQRFLPMTSPTTPPPCIYVQDLRKVSNVTFATF